MLLPHNEGMSEDLVVGDKLVIPERELEWRFTTSGGPGGQHANRSATRAELRWDLGSSEAVDDDLRSGLIARLGTRVQDGVVAVIVDESRSQWRNRQTARRRLAEIVGSALIPPKRRRPTRPGPAAKRRRVEKKRRRAQIKQLRRPPEID